MRYLGNPFSKYPNSLHDDLDPLIMNNNGGPNNLHF